MCSLLQLRRFISIIFIVWKCEALHLEEMVLGFYPNPANNASISFSLERDRNHIVEFILCSLHKSRMEMDWLCSEMVLPLKDDDCKERKV